MAVAVTFSAGNSRWIRSSRSDVFPPDFVATVHGISANAASHADMEFLAREVAALRMAIGEVATRDFVRSELRSLLAELEPDEPEDDEETGGEGDDRDHAGTPTDAD